MTATTTTVSPRKIRSETILRATFGTMLALGCVSFIEPSPYEIFFFLLIPVTFLTKLTLTRPTLWLAILVVFAIGAEGFSLLFHIDDPALDDGLKPVMFTVYSTYLWSSAILFALIFSRQTSERVALALKAYAFSCVFAGIWGILSYLDVAGIGDREQIAGRVAGPFKDPNVLGSYSVLGVVIFLQASVVGRGGIVRLVNLAGLLITLVGGVFLSFSRGSWGATVFSVAFLVIATFVTSNRAMRRTILMSLGGLALVTCVAGGVIASNDTLRSTVTDRAKLEQDYDGGVTGRFGNQMRSIPMLMERPLGFGPHRFAALFNLDPHNSYIGAFSSGGWLGGCVFLLIAVSSVLIAVRLAFTPSPYRRQAQVVAPALISLLLQALQIDIDHWRFFFLMLGLLWGLESARAQRSVAHAGASQVVEDHGLLQPATQ